MIQAPARSKSDKATKYHKVEWKNPKSVQAFMETVIESRPTERAELEQRWYNNILAYWGKNNLRYVSGASDLVKINDREDWQSSIHINRILPFVRDQEAKLTKNDPVIEVMPATNDDDDIQVANVATSVARGYWRKLDMSDKLGDMIRWTYTTGLSYLKACWNPKAGPWLHFTADDYAALFNPEQQAQAMEKFMALAGDKEKSVRMGEIEAEVMSPFSVMFNGNCSFYESSWVIVTKLRDASYAHDNYPKHAEEMTFNDGRSDAAPYESHVGQGKVSGTDYSDTVMVSELFVRRSEALPRGHYAVLCGGVVVESGDNPYVGAHDDTRLDIPIAMMIDLPVPGRVYPTSTVEQMIDAQNAVNEYYNLINDTLNLMSNPVWLCPKNSANPSDLTNSPGAVIGTNPPNEPKRVEGEGVHPDLWNFINGMKGELEDISGQHQVSMARSPSANASGYQTEILREIDDTRLGPFAKALNRCIGQFFMSVLNIATLYLNEERMLRITGKSRQYDVQVMFDGNALMGPNAGKPGINYFDVQIDFTSGLNESSAARREAMFEAINRGVLNVQDPTDKGQIMQYFGFLAKGSDFFHKMQEDQSKQMDENRRMEKGESIPVQPWENHAIELDIVTRRMKMADFNTLPPEAQQLFVQHWQQHQMYATGMQNPGYQPGNPQQQQAMAQGAQMAG